MAFTSLTPGAMLCPVPAVMVSCASEKDRPNIITIAWAGTVCSQPPMVSVAVRKERFSHHIMTDSGEFVVNLVGEGQLRAMDYCGVRSGREEDKFAACQLTPAKGPELRHAPAIAECPLRQFHFPIAAGEFFHRRCVSRPVVKLARQVQCICAGGPLAVDPAVGGVVKTVVFMGVCKVAERPAVCQKPVHTLIVIHAQVDVPFKRAQRGVPLKDRIHGGFSFSFYISLPDHPVHDLFPFYQKKYVV